MNKMTADSFFLLDSHDVKQLGSLIASRLRDIERSSGKETARVLQVGIPSRKRVQKARLHTHSHDRSNTETGIDQGRSWGLV